MFTWFLLDDILGAWLALGIEHRIALRIEHRLLDARHLDLLLDLVEGEVERIAEREDGEGQHPDHGRGQEQEADPAGPAHRVSLMEEAGAASRPGQSIRGSTAV